MGTWGSGNLESDGAQDTLAETCSELFAKLAELLQHPRGHEYDDEEIDQLFVTIETIFALNERGMIISSPDPEELKPLFEDYIGRWESYFRSAGECEPPSDRRNVIVASFERILKISDGSSEGSFSHRLNLIQNKMTTPESDVASGN